MAQDRKRLASLHGVGSVANTLIPKHATAVEDLGIHDLLLAVGRAEFNLGSNPDTRRFRFEGVTDISPRPSDLGFVGGFNASRQMVDDNADLWRPVVQSMIDRLIAALIRA